MTYAPAARRFIPRDVPTLPDGERVEWPPENKLKTLGELHFVAGRALPYLTRPYAIMRYVLETGVQLNQCKVFRAQDGVPRAFVVWALLDRESHLLCIQGKLDQVPPEKWFSGNYFWMMEICAPFSDQHAKSALRWCYDSFGKRKAPWFYRRVDRPEGGRDFVKVTPLHSQKNRIERFDEAGLLQDAEKLHL